MDGQTEFANFNIDKHQIFHEKVLKKFCSDVGIGRKSVRTDRL